jgi:hypothetical protein
MENRPKAERRLRNWFAKRLGCETIDEVDARIAENLKKSKTRH